MCLNAAVGSVVIFEVCFVGRCSIYYFAFNIKVLSFFFLANSWHREMSAKAGGRWCKVKSCKNWTETEGACSKTIWSKSPQKRSEKWTWSFLEHRIFCGHVNPCLLTNRLPQINVCYQSCRLIRGSELRLSADASWTSCRLPICLSFRRLRHGVTKSRFLLWICCHMRSGRLINLANFGALLGVYSSCRRDA